MGAVGSIGAVGSMGAIGSMGGVDLRSWLDGLMMDNESDWLDELILEAVEWGAKDGLKSFA